MSDLHDDLTSIDGVGDATAEKIMAVLDEHGLGETDDLVKKAKAEADAGYYRQAAIYLQRSDLGE